MGLSLQNRLFLDMCSTLSSVCGRMKPYLPRPLKRRRLALAVAFILLGSNGAVLAQSDAKTEAVQTAPEVVVTASRLGTGLTGNSTTVISADEIKQSLGRTIPEVLSFEAGIQFKDLYGSTNGAGQTIDVRGFGEPATANTLILINGRRLSDLDLASVDFSSIPLDSIERIEILRGNLGGVLYGGGVQGGTINIVTKSKAAKGTHGNLATGYGSDVFREVKFSGTQGTDDYSLNVFGNYVDSHGYRDNNALSQKNFTANLRRHGERGDLFVRINLDDQRLGLPGGRIIDPSTGQNDLTDPRGAQTPNDFALQNGLALALGGTFDWNDSIELVLDGSVRRKDQDSDFRNQDQGRDTVLTTWGLTPRVNLDTAFLDRKLSSTLGVDLYYVDYNSDRKRTPSSAPFTRVKGRQYSVAAYAQNTLDLTPKFAATFGIRLERVKFAAGDTAFPGNPGSFGFAQTTFRPSLTDADNEYAWNLGFDYHLVEDIDVYGHIGRGYRTPTIDERSGTAFALNTFELNNQSSQEIEAGTRFKIGPASFDTRGFFMKTRNEIRFDPDDTTTFGANENVDPIHRYGIEGKAGVKLNEKVSLKGNLTLMHARFASGQFEDKDVPLVPDILVSGGLKWKIFKWLTFDTTLSYEGERHLANDEAGTFPVLSGFTLWDVRLGGEYKSLTWSATVNNLFDDDYQSFGTASDTTPGRFSVQTLPGRTFMLRAGAKF